MSLENRNQKLIRFLSPLYWQTMAVPMNENQMHMVFYFLGFLLGEFGSIIWITQWFMLYHNMIEDEKAINKAKYARNTVIIYTIIYLLMYFPAH